MSIIVWNVATGRQAWYWSRSWELMSDPLMQSREGANWKLHEGFWNIKASRAWWLTPLIPALGRQRQVDFWVRGQPGLQSEFQDSQGYTEKPCLEKPKNKKKKKKKKRNIKAIASGTPLPTRLYLLILPKKFHHLGWSIQIYKPMGGGREEEHSHSNHYMYRFGIRWD
jgi:hypothetical protein